MRPPGRLTMPGALVAIALLLGACSGGHKPQQTPTAAPGATASPLPESVDGVPIVQMTLAKSEALPPNAVFYVEGGCIQCDGPATSLDRVYKDGAGNLHADRLFELSNPAGPTNITGIATTEDGHGIAIGIVHWPQTPKDGSPTIPEPTTSFQQSLDGGITWTDIGSVQGLAYPVEVQTLGETGDTLVHRVLGANGTSGSKPVIGYVIMPGTRAQPVGSGLDSGGPFVLFGYGSPRFVLPDGQSLLSYTGGSQPDFATNLPAGGRIDAAGPVPLSLSWAALFTLGDTNPQLPSGNYLAMVPERFGTPSQIYAWPREGSVYYWSGAWLTPDEAVMQVTVPNAYLSQQSSAFDVLSLPAIIDFKTNTVRPIGEYFAQRAATGDRSRVLAVRPGPVVKVRTPGNCVTLRAATSVSASSLGCYKDGVLLADRGETRIVDGATWVGVQSPGRQLGWLSAQDLDAAGRDLSESPKTYPIGTRTANADIDPVLAAIDSADPAQILALTQFTSVACTTQAQGIGGPPNCPPGVADGTRFEAIGSGGCEGDTTLRENYEANLQQLASLAGHLYAVAKVRADSKQGDYLIVYARTSPSWTAGFGLRISRGKIVATSYGCGETPQGFINERFSGIIDSFVLPPR